MRVRSRVCGRACCVLTHACFQKERVYHKNEVVFRQGDLEPSFFLIYKGSIRLEKTNPGTSHCLLSLLEVSARVNRSLKELTLAGHPDAPADDASVEFMRLGVGDSFGEMSLITVRGRVP